MAHKVEMITIEQMFEDGFSFAEIAEKVGATEQQVKTIIHYTYR